MLDYDSIAQDYDAHRRGGGPYSETLIGIARAVAPRRVLELGAGTGNNTAVLLKHMPCTVLGLDQSRGMLRRARAKGLPANWVQAAATRLPVQSGAIDFVFATYLLHHIHDLRALFRECRRVLRPGGRAAFVTVSQDFILTHPMNAYFPSFAQVDGERFQPIPEVLAALEEAGFTATGAQSDTDSPRAIDTGYAERIAARFISTYTLLPPDEFADGLKRLRTDLAAHHGALPQSIAREATTVWGTAPE